MTGAEYRAAVEWFLLWLQPNVGLFLLVLAHFVVGHWLTKSVVDQAWKRMRQRDRSLARDDTPHRAMVGHLERGAFLAAALMQQSEFAVAWLVLKVASQWGRWSNVRDVYNVFLLGTGLNALFGLAGGYGAFLVVRNGRSPLCQVALLI